MAHGHPQAIESSPGDSVHPNCAARPGLAGEPGNDFFAIAQLLLRVFARRSMSFTPSRAPNINTCTHIASGYPVLNHFTVEDVPWVIVIAIRSQLENRREFFFWRSVHWLVEPRGETDTVLHGNPNVFELYFVESGRSSFTP